MVRILRPVAIRLPVNSCHMGMPMDQLFSNVFGNDRVTTGTHFAPFLSVFRPSCCRDHQACVRRPWVHVLQLRGFGAKDISVKVESNKIQIHAKHVQKIGEDFDVIEKVRFIQVPDGVNTKQLKVLVSRVGELVLQAPFKTPGPERKSKESHENKGQKREEHDETTQDLGEQVSQYDENKGNANAIEEGETHVPTEADITGASEVATDNLQNDQASPDTTRCQSPVTSEDFDIIDDQELTCPPNSATDMPATVKEDLMSLPANDKDTLQNHSEGRVMSDHDETSDRNASGDTSLREFKVPLGNIPVENVSIRCHDNVVYVDAEMAEEADGVYKRKEMLRSFPLPAGAVSEKAVATVNSEGELAILVPCVGGNRE